MTGNCDIGLAFMQALWIGDTTTTDAMLTDDATWRFQPAMPQARDGAIQPARQALDRIIADLFGKFDDSGFAVTPTRVIADGDAVAIEYEAHGRTATGQAYDNIYCTVLVIRDSKVAEVHPYNDTAYMLSRIGD